MPPRPPHRFSTRARPREGSRRFRWPRRYVRSDRRRSRYGAGDLSVVVSGRGFWSVVSVFKGGLDGNERAERVTSENRGCFGTVPGDCHPSVASAAQSGARGGHTPSMWRKKMRRRARGRPRGRPRGWPRLCVRWHVCRDFRSVGTSSNGLITPKIKNHMRASSERVLVTAHEAA